MKKILIIVAVLIIVSFIPLFNASVFIGGGGDFSSGARSIIKVNFWRYISS